MRRRTGKGRSGRWAEHRVRSRVAEWLLGRLNGRDAGRGLLPLLTVSTIGAAGVLAVAAPTAAQDYTHPKEMGLPEADFERPDPDAMRVEMANGLAAYVAADDRVPLITLTAFVAAGSVHGTPGEAALVGQALRSGPASMSTGAFHDALDRMTAEYTVTVGREETEITLDVPFEDARAAMELLAATLADPAFSSASGAERAGGREDAGSVGRVGSVESVQGAEGADGPQRAPSVAAIDYASSMAGAVALFEDRLFRGHVHGRRPSGGELAAARSGGAEEFHGSHFVPANTALAVAGDVDAVEASMRLKEAFEGWDGGPAPEPMEPPALGTESPRDVLLGQADKLQGWIVIGHELPVVPPEDEAALHVMDYILGAYHLDSRLFRESREKRGLTNDNSSFLEPGVRGPGSYTMRTYGRPEAVRLLVDITFREVERIRETLPTDDELFVAKGALVDGLYATRYSTGLAAVRSYAREWLRKGGHEWSEGYPDRIRAVTAEDVRKAARKYLHPERMIVAVVGPLGEIAEAAPIESEPALEAWGEVERVESPGR